MLQFSIAFSFFYILIYCLGLGRVFDFEYTFLLFLFSPVVILWVVFSILKDKKCPFQNIYRLFLSGFRYKKNQRDQVIK